MNEEPFKNREILEMFGDVKQDLTEIKEQTKRTNGRVTKLEQWQSYVLGFIAAISLVLVSVVVPLALTLIRTGKL